MSTLNLVCLKIVRWTGWLLLPVVIGFLVTGYRTANGDFSGWLFGLGMVGGAYVGVKFFVWWTERKMARETAGADLQL